jgi:hypothetical protein
MLQSLRLRFVLAFCLLGANFNTGFSDASPPVWWTIQITATVSGHYYAKENPLNLAGRYYFLISCLGSMERDNGDYILYQGEKNIIRSNWQEERGKENLDVSLAMHPEFKLHYVIRKEKEICFDFEIFPLQAGDNYIPVKIVLPCSDENGRINLRSRYNHYILDGSNVIGIMENRLYRENRISQVFRWQWNRKQKNDRQDHAVELKLTIIRKLK